MMDNDQAICDLFNNSEKLSILEKEHADLQHRNEISEESRTKLMKEVDEIGKTMIELLRKKPTINSKPKIINRVKFVGEEARKFPMTDEIRKNMDATVESRYFYVLPDELVINILALACDVEDKEKKLEREMKIREGKKLEKKLFVKETLGLTRMINKYLRCYEENRKRKKSIIDKDDAIIPTLK